MKRKALVTAMIIGLSVVAVGVALALSIGNVDGVWEYVNDVTETQYGSSEVSCSRWATGPGDSPTSISNYQTSVQTGPTTDENQVRYGTGTGISGCSNWSTPSGFANQSGLGFDGRDNVGTVLPVTAGGSPFWLGRFTHYNRPITNFTSWYVDLDLAVSGFLCGNGQPPNEGSTLTFVLRVSYVETANCGDQGGSCSGDCPDGGGLELCPYTVGTDPLCPYVSGINVNGCSDWLDFSPSPAVLTFTCDDDDEPAESKGTWTISLLGFQDNGRSTDCSTQTFGGSALTTSFVTREATDSSSCLWAVVTVGSTAARVTSFTARGTNKSVTLGWQTASEVDSLGFNVYRATSVDGPRTLVNEDLIYSSMPGSSEGATYRYEDIPMGGSGTYFYWVERVDITGNGFLHGPVQVRVR